MLPIIAILGGALYLGGQEVRLEPKVSKLRDLVAEKKNKKEEKRLKKNEERRIKNLEFLESFDKKLEDRLNLLREELRTPNISLEKKEEIIEEIQEIKHDLVQETLLGPSEVLPEST